MLCFPELYKIIAGGSFAELTDNHANSVFGITYMTQAFYSDQNSNVMISSAKVEFGSLRYSFVRSNDSMKYGQPGQDYLAFRYDEHRIAFALCDGVGSSFMGDIAAKFLASKLLDYFWSQKSGYTSKESTPEEKKLLKGNLGKWADECQSLVSKTVIAGDISELQKEALEDLRNTQGSETVFVAGIIERSAESYNVKFGFAGDCEIAVFGKNTTLKYISEMDNGNRWASKKGLRGKLTLMQFSNITRATVKSDGLPISSKHIPAFSNSMLYQKAVAMWFNNKSDDISVFDILLGDVIEEDSFSSKPEEIDSIKPRKINSSDGIKIIWDPIDAADYYIVEQPAKSHMTSEPLKYITKGNDYAGNKNLKRINVSAHSANKVWRSGWLDIVDLQEYKGRNNPPIKFRAGVANSEAPSFLEKKFWLRWDIEDPVEGYYLEQSENSQFSAPNITELYQNKIELLYNDLNRISPKTYYRVRAFWGNVIGDYCDEVCVLEIAASNKLASIGISRKFGCFGSLSEVNLLADNLMAEYFSFVNTYKTTIKTEAKNIIAEYEGKVIPASFQVDRKFPSGKYTLLKSVISHQHQARFALELEFRLDY